MKTKKYHKEDAFFLVWFNSVGKHCHCFQTENLVPSEKLECAKDAASFPSFPAPASFSHKSRLGQVSDQMTRRHVSHTSHDLHSSYSSFSLLSQFSFLSVHSVRFRLLIGQHMLYFLYFTHALCIPRK